MKPELQALWDRYLKLQLAERSHVCAHLFGWLDATGDGHDIKHTIDGLDSALTYAEQHRRVSPEMGTRHRT